MLPSMQIRRSAAEAVAISHFGILPLPYNILQLGAKLPSYGQYLIHHTGVIFQEKKRLRQLPSATGPIIT